MSSFNRKNTVPLANYNIPVGVIIGKKGSNIKYMSSQSGAYMKVMGNSLSINGGYKQLMEAKRLLKQLETNFHNGIPGFINCAPEPRKQRSAISMDNDGWSTKGEYKSEENLSEPQKMNTEYSGNFAGLESDDEVDIDDEEEIEKAVVNSMYGRSGLEAVGVFASKLPKTRSYAEINRDISDTEKLIADLSNSWADSADREEYEDELKEFIKEKETVDRIQLIIQEHPDM